MNKLRHENAMYKASVQKNTGVSEIRVFKGIMTTR
jgi:hypothetical protein